MDEPRTLAAIAALRRVVAEQSAIVRAGDRRRVDAIRMMATTVRASFDEVRCQLLTQIEGRLLPVDPLRQTWNVFRLFDLEYKETRWTQWLAAILRPENGERCARVAWTAFCEAVARRAAVHPPSGISPVLDAIGWRAAASEVPIVEAEVPHLEHGRLDMLATTPTLVAAIENKLWADWHDGAHEKQADRYRKIALARLEEDPVRHLGLVLLSQRADLQPGRDYPSDYIHVSWRDLGQALRRALPAGWHADAAIAIDLWPIVLTLVSIEQDLLDLSLAPMHEGSTNPVATIRALTALANYLEDR